jgi:hypothetical protein
MSCAAKRKKPIVVADGEPEMREEKIPGGWDEEGLRQILAHYDGQTEDEQFAEIEASQGAEGISMMALPTDLLPKLRVILARKQSD